MEYIRKSIYNLPEIRRAVRPLWSAWIIAAIGAICGVIYFLVPNMSAGLTSFMLGGLIVGALSLTIVLCYWLFGDSRRPYSRELHTLLEPTYAYYPNGAEASVKAALEGKDEKALDAIKRQLKPELALVRYSDANETVFYSQLTRVEGTRYVPLTEIIVNKL